MCSVSLGHTSKTIILDGNGGVNDKTIRYLESLGLRVIVLFRNVRRTV